MYHTMSHQYVWVMVCCLQLEVQKTSLDQRRLLPSMASMVMIKSGSMWETCHLHVPWVDTLLLSDGGLLVVDGRTQQVLRITVQGKYSLYWI